MEVEFIGYEVEDDCKDEAVWCRRGWDGYSIGTLRRAFGGPVE